MILSKPDIFDSINFNYKVQIMKSHRQLLKLLLQGWLFMILPVFFLCTNPAAAQKKIYIRTDLEGISGVYRWDQVGLEENNALYQKACEYYMDDVAAVVRGLRDGGATEILICDGHGPKAVIPHMMVPGAKYITGKIVPGTGKSGKSRFWGLDSSFAGVVLLGAHAMKGTPDGILNHTEDAGRYWYNGVESGELAQNAAMAGFFGVPPIMVTGDEATCREARNFFGDKCITVAVKLGISEERAVLYPFEETHKALYEGAKRAVKAIPLCKPYILELPIHAKKIYPPPGTKDKEGIIQSAFDIMEF